MSDKSQSTAWALYRKQIDAYEAQLTPDQRQILSHYTHQNGTFDAFYMKYQDPSAFVDPSTSPGPPQAEPTLDLDWSKVSQWARAKGYTARAVGPKPGVSHFPDGRPAKVPPPKGDGTKAALDAHPDLMGILARAIHMQFRPERYAPPAVNAAPGVHQVE